MADFGVGEFSPGGEVEEFLVGHGGPKEVGELGGEGEVVGFFLAIEEEELGSAEDGGDAGADGLLEGAAFGESIEGEIDEGVGGFPGDGSSEGAGDEGANDAFGIGFGSGGDDVVGFDAFAVAHPDGGAGFEGDGRRISKEGFLSDGREGLIEGTMGFGPDDADAGLLLVFVAPGDVVGVDPGNDVEGFGFCEEGFEFDNAGSFRGAGDIEHAHEAALAGAEEGAGVDGNSEGAIAGIVRPDRDAASVATVFDGVGFIDANGRPAGGEFDEGVADFDDAAFLFGEGVEVVLVLSDEGAAGLSWKGRDAADGGFKSDVGSFEITLHEDGGEAETVGDVVEALDFAVLGEEVGEGGVDAEEVADGEFVFDAVEATKGNGRLGGFEKGFCQGGDGFFELCGIGARFLFGRHVAIFEGLEDEVPVVGIGGEGVEAEVAFLLIGAVAFEAVVLEKGLRSPCREDGRGEESEKDVAQGHEDITGRDWKTVQMQSRLW